MYCGNCGEKIPEGGTFCPSCGFKVNAKPAGEKSMVLALLISFFLTGIGITYVGDRKKGITLFLVFLIFYVFSSMVPICFVVSSIIWAYGLFETYRQVKRANGEANSNLIEDVKGFSTPKKVATLILVAFVLLMIVGGLIVVLMPHDYTVSDYGGSSSGNSYSSGSGYSSSGGSNHYHTVVGDRQSLAYSDPDSYYDHYEYGDDYDIDNYLESEGYD